MIYRGIFITSLFTLSVQAYAKDSGTPQLPTGSCAPAPIATLKTPQNNINNPDAMIISADRVYGGLQGSIHFEGRVEATQGDRKLIAESASLDHGSSQLKADSQVHYQDSAIDVQARFMLSRSDSHKVQLNDTKYQMRQDNSRGMAKKMVLNQQNESVTLHDGTFTTCPKGDNSWLLKAKKLHLDGESEWGSASNATFRVAGVPVLWVPYMTFPLSDKRKSGLLFPELSNSSDNGLSYSQPVYWNIKENMDATITPRYISKRGTQLKSELRHLTQHQYNQLNLEYLSSDQELSAPDARYFVMWRHKAKWTPNWRTSVKFAQVSDDNYFNDLGSEFINTTSSRLTRRASVDYLAEQLDFSASIVDYDIFGAEGELYRQLPRFNLEYRLPQLFDNIESKIESELIYFNHTDDEHATATRLHIEPQLTYNWYTPAASFEAETKLYQTFYRQNNLDPEEKLSRSLEESVSRTIPSLRLQGQLNFERQTELFKSEFVQTLEPKLQYLYVPYRYQQGIDGYDTMGVRDDYYGLFRDQRFSSIDRIADASQITLGVTSRFLNQLNQETFRISMGQIFYLKDSQIIKELTGTDGDSASSFALSLDSTINHYHLHAEYQYNFERSQIETSNLLLNYQPSARKLAQLSYHYAPQPLNFSRSESVIEANKEINQLGLVTSWPLSESTQLIGSYYRDLNLHRSIESLLGIQYESCCWAIRLAHQRTLNTNFPDEEHERNPFDSGISLQFEIRGFGNSKLSDHKTLLKQSLFGYRQSGQ